MADAAATIGVIGGVVGILGGSGGLVSVWRAWHQEHREEEQSFFASYERSIQLLKEQHQRESDPAKKEAKRQQLETVENEYLEQQEAYRQNCALRQTAPRGALTAERRLPTESVRIELTELLEKTRLLSPALLTAEDHFLRGNALYALGRYEEALADYNRALDPRHEDPAVQYAIACLCSLLERYDEALQWLEKAISGNPENRAVAREDEDFAALRADPQFGPRFEKLIQEETP